MYNITQINYQHTDTIGSSLQLPLREDMPAFIISSTSNKFSAMVVLQVHGDREKKKVSC